MSDIEKAFAFLHNNTPSWIEDVSEIERKIVRMQEELAKMPLSRSLLKKRTGSVESIRDLDTPTSTDDQDNSPTPYIALHPSRKRKTPTVTSGNASGPPKFRSRMMVIVTYDGQIQSSFEALVRAIGTGRNMLRKGKMAAKAEEIAALAAFEEEESEDEDPYAFVNSKIGYRHRTGLSSLRAKGTKDEEPESAVPKVTPTEIFDVPDKALESAQGLCEKAAHQSLRDGDCRKELEAVKKHFQDIYERAAVEVSKHIARRQAEEEAQKKAEEESKHAIEPMEVEPTPAVPDAKLAPLIAAGPPPGGMDIEVDDDDEDDMDFVMPPIRLTSRA